MWQSDFFLFAYFVLFPIFTDVPICFSTLIYIHYYFFLHLFMNYFVKFKANNTEINP